MARLVQGMRNILCQTSTIARLSVNRVAIQQRCMHSSRFAGMIAPSLLQNKTNVQVIIYYLLSSITNT